MVILGLGTNLGDKLANLRQALAAIQTIHELTVQQVSPIYLSDALLPDNPPSDWDQPYLNLALRCETSLDPMVLLKQLKEIEERIGRKPTIRHWGPRVIDIDILAWDNKIIQTDALSLPHISLTSRPFALWPLVDVAPLWVFPGQEKTAAQMAEQWGSRFTGEAPFRTKQLLQRIDAPSLVGIINVTPDSFSDGGQFYHLEQALHQTIHLMESGAEIIDIGAESTAPTSKPIDAKTEWERLEPVLKTIQSTKGQYILPPKISIDTRHVEVAELALKNGVDWINDVTGLQDKKMCNLLTEAKVDCVVMHHLSIPPHRDCVLKPDISAAKQVYEWAEKHFIHLEDQGIARERIIFDPGIGFGKTATQSLNLIQQVQFFKTLGTRLLIGHSRKSFLSLLTNKPFKERDIETVAITLALLKQPVHYLRVHNVEFNARGIRAALAASATV